MKRPAMANERRKAAATVERYKRGRHWAVYDGSGLVAVTVYKKGAETVAGRLNARGAAVTKGAKR